jgi:hypothetical protein
MRTIVGSVEGRLHRAGRDTLILLACAAFVAACSGREPAEQKDTTAAAAPAATSPAVAVTIMSPSKGDTVRGSAVHIALSASGIELAPAADARPGTAHHHLYLDTDLSAADTAIPAGTAGIVHLGKAETEYHWDSVAPGAHRIIAVLADPTHVPLKPLVADTVNITVVK